MSATLFEGFIVFIFGCVIGSFLNVVACRYGTGVGVGGRSKCDSCDTTLRWYELVPIVSFLSLRARCGRCEARLSWQHPIIEALTGLLFLLGFLSFASHLSYVRFALELVMLSSVVIIVAYDARHMIIPQVPLMVFAVSALFAMPGLLEEPGTQRFVAGLVLFAPFYLLWRFSQGKWIGLGDADIAAAMGFYLGLSGGLAAIALAFLVGAAYGLAVMSVALFGRRYRREVPFAPFLLAGFVIVFTLVNVPQARETVERLMPESPFLYQTR